MLGNVRNGVADTEALLARYTEITARLAEEYSDELMTEMGLLQGPIGPSRRLGSRPPVSTRRWRR